LILAQAIPALIRPSCIRSTSLPLAAPPCIPHGRGARDPQFVRYLLSHPERPTASARAPHDGGNMHRIKFPRWHTCPHRERYTSGLPVHPRWQERILFAGLLTFQTEPLPLFEFRRRYSPALPLRAARRTPLDRGSAEHRV
jgi:hypothetical protein